MNNNNPQLQALLKKVEADELECLQEWRAMKDVCDRREMEFSEIHTQIVEKQKRLQKFSKGARQEAVRGKEIENLVSGVSFTHRLRSEIEALLPQLQERREDLERAQQRLQLRAAELQTAQVERKRVERLLESRAQVRRMEAEAQEESMSDELVTMNPGGRRTS